MSTSYYHHHAKSLAEQYNALDPIAVHKSWLPYLPDQPGKGLRTTDDQEADKLVEELNTLLGDQSWWTIDRKSEALNCFDH